MQITEIKEGHRTVLRIQGALDIGVAEELHKALRDFLRDAQSPVLDLSGVEACDTAALQLLYAARKTADSSAKRLEFVGLPDAVSSVGAALGLAVSELGPEDTPAQPAPAAVAKQEQARAI